MGNEHGSMNKSSKPYLSKSDDKTGEGLRYTQFEAPGYGKFTCANVSPGMKPTLAQWTVELAQKTLQFDPQWSGDVFVLIKVVGPSGCGKSLLVKRLFRGDDKVQAMKVEMTSKLEEFYKESTVNKLFAGYKERDSLDGMPRQEKGESDESHMKKFREWNENRDKMMNESLSAVILESRANHGTFFMDVQCSVLQKSFKKLVEAMGRNDEHSDSQGKDEDEAGEKDSHQPIDVTVEEVSSSTADAGDAPTEVVSVVNVVRKRTPPRFNFMLVESSSKYGDSLACLDTQLAKVVPADFANGKRALLVLEMALDPTSSTVKVAPTASLGECVLLPPGDETPQLTMVIPVELSVQEKFAKKLKKLDYNPDDILPVSDEFADLMIKPQSGHVTKTVLEQVIASRKLGALGTKRSANDAQLEDRTDNKSSE